MHLVEVTSIYQWIGFGIGIMGLVLSYLESRHRLPKWAREWLTRIGHERIYDAVVYAARFEEMTSEERRRAAVTYLVRVVRNELGLNLPESIVITPLGISILGRRYNRTLHGRSVHRRTDVPGHNVVIGYSRPGTGDALDIFVPAGMPVYAMHSGTVSRIADRDGRLACIYITGGGITTVYAHLHIRESISIGMKVTHGQVIGWVGRVLKDPHLHLEVWIGGKVLSAMKPALLAERIDREIS